MIQRFAKGCFGLFFLGIQSANAQEIANQTMRDITNAVTQLCHIPSRRGEYWNVTTTGEGGAIIRLIGVKGQATFSKGEWDGVKEVLPEGQVPDRERASRCAERLVPIFIEKFAGESTSRPGVSGSPLSRDISGSYLMDQLSHRVVVISQLSGATYRIEEPSGSWPWEGTATLDGGSIYGEARFRNDLTTIRVKGIVRADGSIVVDYEYVADRNGNPAPAPRRVDKHVWYPVRR